MKDIEKNKNKNIFPQILKMLLYKKEFICNFEKLTKTKFIIFQFVCFSFFPFDACHFFFFNFAETKF